MPKVGPYKFSERSLRSYSELHPHLQKICNLAIKQVDFMILDGTRSRPEQELAFKNGFSKARFGKSAHNYIPAIAMDLVPYPTMFQSIPKFRTMAKVIMASADELDVPLRWGADWDMDGKWEDERFLDWGHFELHPWRKWASESRLIEG